MVEWRRGWCLSGFSWLSLGYSQTDTWLSRFAPGTGVYGISTILLVCAGALLAMVLGKTQTRIIAAIVFVVPWIAGAALGSVEWTQPSGPPVTVAVVQGAIPQDQKWLESNTQATLDLYQRLTETTLGTRVIVWPESAPPVAVNEIVDYITNIYREARAHHSALVTGVVRFTDDDHGYNSILALDDKLSWYNKDHLVPFAEFFPVPTFVRSWLRLHSLPGAGGARGGGGRPPRPAAGRERGAARGD